MNAPRNWAIRYIGTWSHGVLPTMARPRVTAGFRCAPLYGPATTTPEKTASPHASVMTIQPPANAFDLFNRTPATTPSPRRIRIMVPIISATNASGFMLTPSSAVSYTHLRAHEPDSYLV